MAQDATTGQKRGPGRPSKASQPVLKKSKLSTPLQTPTTSSLQSPAGQSPAPEKRSNKLPAKISDNRPLPTLSQPQALALSNDEYQSIATSAVLAASLDRSRLKWVSEGILDRYWTKPESGKNARPPPPNNPELKWQKHKGPCRIRIEPHIFEAEIYVEEKAVKPAAPAKQYAPPSAYGQPYRPAYGMGQQNQSPYYQGRNVLPPIQQPANTLPPIQNISQTPTLPQPPPSRAQPSQPQPQQQQEKKASPDPVISMLANRASSDPELKALMKEVATGNATQDQLKVFQGHIDELTKLINDKKKKEEAEEEAAKTKAQQQTEIIQHDGPADTSVTVPTPPPPQQQRPPPYQPPQPVYQQPAQQAWAPPPPPPPPAAPTSQPVIIQFTTPGATEDRFLFPQHSILESLSPQHLLASFIVTHRASSPSTTNLVAGTEEEYWQPITLMVEVAYNREHILECVKKWVKPAEEVRKYMEGIMGRCTRAPETHLALRLPVKGSALAATEAEDLSVVEEAGEGVREKVGERKGPNVKYIKKTPKIEAGAKGQIDGGGKKPAVTEDGKGTAATLAASTSAQSATSGSAMKTDGAPDTAGGDAETTGTGESGRPRRAVRKSVRISEG